MCLAGWWPLDDEARIQDMVTGAIGNNNSAIGPTYRATRNIKHPQVGSFLRITGNAATYIDLNRIAGLAIDAFTLSAWVYYTDVSEGHYILGTAASAFDWSYNGTMFSFTLRGVYGDTATVAVSLNVPHHIAITRIGTALSYYLDGQLVVTNTTSGGAGSAPTALFAMSSGTAGAAESGAGNNLTDIRYYNRVLTLEEIWSLYDPATRWNLYYQPSPRVFFNVGSSVLAVTGAFQASTAALFAPSMVTQNVSGTFISSAGQSYAPAVVQVIAMPTIVAGTTIFAPSIAAGAVTITGAFISSGEVDYPPSLVGNQSVTGQFISSGSSVTAPTVIQNVVGAFITSGATINAATVSAASVTITGATITSGSFALAPTVHRQGDPPVNLGANAMSAHSNVMSGFIGSIQE